jgi:hypothetical protein
MNRHLASTLLSAIVLFAIVPVSAQSFQKHKDKSSSAPCKLTSDDYSVYSAMLNGRGRPEDPEERWDDKPQLIIADSTGKGGALFKERKGLWSSGFRTNSKNKPADDTERDFMLKLESECAVEMGMENAPSYRLISRKEVDEIFKKNDGWEEFYKRYPKSSGIWSFSRVGYNAAANEALVYVVHSCGMLCGTGHLYLLTKQNEKWMVKDRLMLWIS